MSMEFDSLIRGMAQTMTEKAKETVPYDTTATVTRIDGSTAYVHIEGGVDETPVEMTISAKVGDTVQVRVSGGRAWLTGNATAPPTDDTTAKEAKQEVKKESKERYAQIKIVSDDLESEVNARQILIRQGSNGIEVGYEDGGYKALINAGGSFDVVTESGETVASFSEESTMRSKWIETWSDDDTESEYQVEVESWQQLTPVGTQFYKRERSIDEDFYYDKSQTTIIDAYGVRPQGSGAIFALGVGVRAPKETRLWHSQDTHGDYIIEGTWYGAGYLTGSRTSVRFTIPLSVPIIEGQTITCYTMNLTLRQNGNYVLGDGSGTEAVDESRVYAYICPSGLNVEYSSPTTLTSGTNNDSIGIACEYSFKVISSDWE